MRAIRGKVKYADQSREYGYIVPDQAVDPRASVYFEVEDSIASFEQLTQGTSVEYSESISADGTAMQKTGPSQWGLSFVCGSELD